LVEGRSFKGLYVRVKNRFRQELREMLKMEIENKGLMKKKVIILLAKGEVL